MSSIRVDRMWMYKRLVPSRTTVTSEFIEGVRRFIEFALMQPDFVSNGSIRCPCSKCKNSSGFLEPHDIRSHLYKHGFMPNYHQWESHGESFVPISRPQLGINTGDEIGANKTPINPYRTMVLDAAGPSFNLDSDVFDMDIDEEEPPNQNAKEFFEMLKAAEEPLFDGCRTHSPLSAVCRLLNIKSESNMSDNCYNQILLFLKELLPEDAKLPVDYYRTKQMVAKLGLRYEKIDPNVQTRLNKVTRNDDGGEVDAPDGCLSIFLHPGRPSGEMNGRYLSDKEWDATRIYVLLNCEEIQQFIPIFEAELKRNSENISLEEIDKETNSRFANWFEAYVFNPANNISDERLRDLASGPYKWVQTWPQYFTNGYRFHTLSHGSNKSTMNSGVCIKGTTWNDYESDYYGLLGEVIQLEYSNPTKKRTTLVLFKCDWFDPTMGRGCKVHNQYGLIDINHKKRFSSYAYEPFVLAKQAQQVYFAEYPSKRKDSIDWWAVCKIKARNQIDSPNISYQEDDNLPPIIPNITDDLDSLRHENGELEIHEVENETDDIDQEHDINAIESDEEIEESDCELSEDEGDEQSDENFETDESE
ncbi:hypothetical protein RDI58_017687 [Solanum bulbocastanum]